MLSAFRPLVFQILSVLTLIRVGYAQTDSIEDRIAYAKGVLNEGLKKNDSVKMAEGYYLLAKRMVDVNNLEEAYRLFYLSLKLNEKLENHYNRGRIFMRLSELEIDLGNFEGAKEFREEATLIFKNNNLKEEIKAAHSSLGFPQFQNIYSERQYASLDPDSLLRYFKKQEKEAITQKNNMDLALLRYLIGNVYSELKDKRAITYLESAVNLAKSNQLLRPSVRYYIALASTYILFDQLSKAEVILAESQEIINKGHFQPPSVLSDHYESYSKYYAATGDWKSALIARDSSSRYLRHLIKSDRTGNISRWRVQMETEKKDLELKLNKQEIENKQNLIRQQQLFMRILVVFSLILILLTYYLYKNYRKQAVLTRKNSILVQEQNHRVKNNLQVISSMLNLQVDYLNDLKSKNIFSESQTRIDSMVLLHRQLYENDNVEFINIHDLLHDISQSVALTFGRVSFEIVLNMEVNQLKTDLATSVGLIINELIINSFKYVFIDRPPKIAISSRQNGAFVEISYRDFGTKDLTDLFQYPDLKGFGLNLVDMILFQINGTLDYQYESGSVFSISFLNT